MHAPDCLLLFKPFRHRWIGWIAAVLAVNALLMAYTLILLRAGYQPHTAIWLASAVSGLTIWLLQRLITLTRTIRLAHPQA